VQQTALGQAHVFENLDYDVVPQDDRDELHSIHTDRVRVATLVLPEGPVVHRGGDSVVVDPADDERMSGYVHEKLFELIPPVGCNPATGIQ